MNLKRGRAILNRLIRDWQWKLLSAAIAAVIFSTIRARISETIAIAVPVAVETDPGVAVASVDPLSVQVTFRGSSAGLQQLDRRDLAVLIAPHGMRDGETTAQIAVNRRRIRGAEGLQIVQVEPSSVRVRFDAQGTVSLPVAEPPLNGKPLRGTARVSYQPEKVEITGSKRALEELRNTGGQLQTLPIDVEGRSQSFTTRVRVLPPAGIVLSTIDPIEIIARVEIAIEQVTREFAHQPVRIIQALEPGRRLHADPPYVTVRLTGRADIVQAVAPESLAVFVAETGDPEAARTNGVQPIVHTPHELAIDGVSTFPETIRLLPESAR